MADKIIYLNYFNYEEFLIDPAMRKPESEIPLHVVQKIENYHLPELNLMRHKGGFPIRISQHSGYRPVAWEKDRGRSGDSQHCFGENLPKSDWYLHRGAVDVTCGEDNFPQLLKLAKASKYSRVCWYPDAQFIHMDWKYHWKGEYSFWIAETNIVEKDGKTTVKTEWKRQDDR